MLITLLGKRCPHHLVGGALFRPTQPAIADRLLHRPEARHISDLQRPAQRRDGPHSGNGFESLEPLRQQRITLERFPQDLFGFSGTAGSPPGSPAAAVECWLKPPGDSKPPLRN